MSLAMSPGPAAVSAPPPASPPALCAASPPGALAGALRLAGLRTPCAWHLRAPAAHRRLTPALAAGARVLVLAVRSLILPGAESARPPRAPLQPSEREGPAFHASPPIRPRSHCRVAARSRMRPRARKDRGLSTCFVGRGCLASMQGRGTEPLWGFRRHACPRPQQGWSGHSRAKAATCPTPPEACRTAQPGRGLSPGPGSQANESEPSPAGSPRTRVAVRGWTWLQGAAGEQAGDPAPLSPGWTCHRVPLTLLRPQPAAMSRHTAETSG